MKVQLIFYFMILFIHMKLDSELLTKRIIPLVGFLGTTIPVKETILLITIAGQSPKQVVAQINYFIVKNPSIYNVILGRSGLNVLKVIVSTYHLMVKFSPPEEIDELRRNQWLMKECYMATL